MRKGKKKQAGREEGRKGRPRGKGESNPPGAAKQRLTRKGKTELGENLHLRVKDLSWRPQQNQ